MNTIKNYSQAVKNAYSLLNKLENEAKLHPKKFCENYGQSDVRKFKDKLDCINSLSYSEKANVLRIVERVMDITPY